MEKKTTHHPRCGTSRIKLMSRNRRQENFNNLSKEQQAIQQTITTRVDEFHQKVELLNMKLKEVRAHVKHTKNRLNSLRRHSDLWRNYNE